MKASIFCYSLKGKDTARRVYDIITKEYGAEVECFSPSRIADEGGGYGRDVLEFEPGHDGEVLDPAFSGIPRPSGDFYGEHFRSKDLLISVGSVGICVRHVAPYVKSKVTDPAVIVIDELGQHVIPVLSGHIGGANGISRVLAEGLESEAVITTATDINGRFTVDEWAAKNNLAISSMIMAKDFAAAILERNLPFRTDFPYKGALPSGLNSQEDISSNDLPYGEDTIGMYVTWTTREPFPRTLRLIPKCLALGIGCRKDTPMEAIEQAVRKTLKDNMIDIRAVDSIASIDLKKDEKGLLEYGRKMRIEPEFFTADELREVQGDFTPSEFVKGITGVDNVCERAALIKADKLIVKKTACDGVTVAVAVKDMEVNFE